MKLDEADVIWTPESDQCGSSVTLRGKLTEALASSQRLPRPTLNQPVVFELTKHGLLGLILEALVVPLCLIIRHTILVP